MISKNVYLFCKDDASLIENYKLALNDKSQTWDIHHRLETDLGLSRDELIEQNRYFNVPAKELIFLTKAEHTRLHQTGSKRSEETKKNLSEKQKGENNSMYGKEPWNKGQYGKCSEETLTKISIAQKKRFEDPKEHQKISNTLKGNTPWNKGKKGVQQAWNKGMTKEEMKNYKKK